MTFRPGKSFRVGAMRERVTIQQQTDTRDDSGQAVTTWTDLYTNEPARFTQTGGGQTYRGQQLQEDIIAVFVVRWRSDLENTKLRVVFDSANYGITRAQRVDGGRRYLELFARAVA